MERLKRLFDHLKWADEAVLESLRAAADPPAEAIELFAHVLGAELVWLDRVEGADQSVAVWPEASRDDLGRLARRSRARYETFVGGLSSRDLAREIAYTNSAGQRFDSRLDDILVHVALHGTYHRGQIAWLLRGAGSEPAPTDYIAFVRGAPAARRDDAEGIG